MLKRKDWEYTWRINKSFLLSATGLLKEAEDELKDIPVKDLCRLSLIYAKLSEKSNEDENMAMATKCFHQATEISADTVVEFFAKLPVEDAQYGELLKMLSSAIDAPRDISDRDYEDCVEEEHEHEHDDK